MSVVAQSFLFCSWDDKMATGFDHVIILDKEWVRIKQSATISNDLLAYLVADQVISHDEKETIQVFFFTSGLVEIVIE